MQPTAERIIDRIQHQSSATASNRLATKPTFEHVANSRAYHRPYPTSEQCTRPDLRAELNQVSTRQRITDNRDNNCATCRAYHRATYRSVLRSCRIREKPTNLTAVHFRYPRLYLTSSTVRQLLWPIRPQQQLPRLQLQCVYSHHYCKQPSRCVWVLPLAIRVEVGSSILHSSLKMATEYFARSA